MPRPVTPAVDRFHAKVDTSGGPDACHPWTAALFTLTGYGTFHPTKGETVGAHRWAYETFVGPIPDGFHVDHTCHNVDLSCPGGRACLHRACVNLTHLEAVPVKINGNRSHNSNAQKRECPRGHLYTPENTHWQKPRRQGQAPRRTCRVCARALSRARGNGPRAVAPIDPDRVRVLYAAGLGATAMSKQLGVGLPRLYDVMVTLGLPRRPAGRVPRKAA